MVFDRAAGSIDTLTGIFRRITREGWTENDPFPVDEDWSPKQVHTQDIIAAEQYYIFYFAKIVINVRSIDKKANPAVISQVWMVVLIQYKK